MLIKIWLGAAVPALVGNAGIITDTVQADAQIRAALVAAFAPAGQTG